MMHFFGRLLGFENVQSIDSIDVAFAAPWAGNHLGTFFGGCLLACGAVVVFYRRFEHCPSRRLRISLTAIRAAVVCLLIVTLAAPLLHSSATVSRPPLVVLIVDDSESMKIADVGARGSRSEAQADQLANQPSSATRTETLRRLFSEQGGGFIRRLEENAACRVEVFQLASDKATSLEKIDRNALHSALVGDGQTTPLLNALVSIQKQVHAERIAATIVFSDFVDTSSNVARDEFASALSSIGSPIHAVGLGATKSIDVAIELRSEGKVKLGEPMTVTVELRHSGFDGHQATVSLEARPLQYDSANETPAVQQIGERALSLAAPLTTTEFSFTPDTAGDIELVARVAPLAGEVLLENNIASRQVGVIEDFLRITYVDYEPNWEWRFIKEVFGRDKLVGRDGFRTYLASAAADVRSANDLFTSELTLPRNEFFTNDVLFVGDLPSELLTPEFCELADEFVSRLGGGLVVVAGPRFGLVELADTPLAKLLPVAVNHESPLRDQTEFTLQRTSAAALFPFMQLADSESENDAAWNNLGKLPWYRPVASVHEHAQVLAEHPADFCDDGRTRQPLIAIRPYGKGQVVYVGFNEMWRLRKRYGDRYYQRFWSQLIYRLGMSHAIGAEKRFVAGFDRAAYQVGDEAVFSVDAYDDQYEPLGLSRLTNGALVGELMAPDNSGNATHKLSLPATRPGHFEALVPLSVAGRYTIRITDPINGRTHERSCMVSELSAERREIVRNVDLQRQIAELTGGEAYDISQVENVIDDLALEPTFEQEHRQIALWNTPMWFLLVVGLMLSEWTIRKLAFLR